MERKYGTRLSDLPETEEQLADKQSRAIQRFSARSTKKSPSKWQSIIRIDERHDSEVSLLVQAVVEPYGKTLEGELVRAVSIPWRAIVGHLKLDWKEAFKIPPRMWEEIIAGAFEQEGYETILTPRSGDYGRDVIATKHGVGCVRIIDSVKAYAPHRLVLHDDVRALLGVLAGDPKASKGMLTTTSDFAPGIITDPYLSPSIPTRLELMNGKCLREWLVSLAQ